ncbi:MAG TPA: DEAD/DEAH box helicase, partial [Terriglobales bacterium]|nr:DEAD/DEAH box helicase [Terriglobales bacterium]
MIDVPSFVNFVAAENAAAGMSRGLVERMEAWGTLVAQAQRILAEVQNDLSRRAWGYDPAAYYDPGYSAPLIAAARVLDAAASARSLEGDQRQRLAMCAAAGFAMGGNFPSAKAALDGNAALERQRSPFVWLAVGCFSPQLLGRARIVAVEQENALCSEAIESLQAYLATAEYDLIRRLDQFILRMFDACVDNFESILLGYARVAVRHLALLSTRNALQAALPESVVGRLLDAELFTLLPSQYGVLCQSQFLNSSQNALLCLPTSTGKTLIGEIAIARALAQGPGLAIYIAPYIAIGVQAGRALRKHLPRQYRVHTLVAGLSPEFPINSTDHREIVVTTPERLDSILRHYSKLDDLRIVVMDEAHMVEDGVRGAKAEALLSRLRLQQHRGRKFRIVALSAVMAQSANFRDWLGVPDEMFHSCLWRPTARRVALWRSNNKLTWLYAGDELRPPGAKSTDILGTRKLVWPRSMYPAHDFARIKSQTSAFFTNAAYLCRHLYEEYHQPILCVCASRSSSRGVAAQLAEEFEPYEVLDDLLVEIIGFIDGQAQHLMGLKQCLLSGVAYHNAALPFRLRQLIEQAVERRILRVVCATTTLAEGVDLPFRVTVLADWLQWRMDTKSQQQPFGALKFRNIAGRAGRAGVFTEGDTVVFENLLGPSRFVDHQNRTGAILTMLDTPRQVQSALEEEDIVPTELEARKRVLSSNFLAAIRENPDDESLEKSFAKVLLLRKLPSGETAEQLASKIKAGVLEGGD